MRITLATTNPNKVREMTPVFAAHGIEALAIPEGFLAGVEEWGASFCENADIKSRAGSFLVPGLVVAEDSGLEIDELGGYPGVLSSRIAAADSERIATVLAKLAGVPALDRNARFRTCASLARAGVVLHRTEGVVEGLITEAPLGANGFGYDPVFLHPPSGKTFAELALEEKNRVSHRMRALTAMAEYLLRHPEMFESR